MEGAHHDILLLESARQGLDQGDAARAAEHLKACVAFDAKYSAAWKLLGKAYQLQGDVAGARQAWTDGLAAAQAHGDKQAEKEMTVFLRKLDKA